MLAPCNRRMFIHSALALLAFSMLTACGPVMNRKPILILAGSTPAPVGVPDSGTFLNRVDPYAAYYGEILKAEGLNEFDLLPTRQASLPLLKRYDVVLVGNTRDWPLTDSQVIMFHDYVMSGGNLIAMRPDKKLSVLLGLNDLASTFDESVSKQRYYLGIDTSNLPGTGITSQTLQFHGPTDLYSIPRFMLDRPVTVASLYSDSSTNSHYPAVTIRSPSGTTGNAACFTYDLARSVILTRQGNPTWAAQPRMKQFFGMSGTALDSNPIRSADMFVAIPNDVSPSWIDFSKIAIPQADEQQRLLANLILTIDATKNTLPRFWYFPNAKKAVLVMTSDCHGPPDSPFPPDQVVKRRFDVCLSHSPPGGDVSKWQCVRATIYLWPDNSPLTDSEAASYQAQGFEVADHVNPSAAGAPDNWTAATLDNAYKTQLAQFKMIFPDLCPPTTIRDHYIGWTDYDSLPKTELRYGIRLDTDYYYYPSGWVLNRPGMFTGSGIPMRFADINGRIIDVYQAVTQVPNEGGVFVVSAGLTPLLDNATGPLGYYGALTINPHLDPDASTNGDDKFAVDAIEAAQSHDVPVVSARQLLDWIDGRDKSYFSNIQSDGLSLQFKIYVAPGATGLMQAMIPARSSVVPGTIVGITCNGNSVPFTVQTIKGIGYAFFAAVSGNCKVVYRLTTPPHP